jgi:hypothetical protein
MDVLHSCYKEQKSVKAICQTHCLRGTTECVSPFSYRTIPFGERTNHRNRPPDWSEKNFLVRRILNTIGEYN